jgi:transposase
MEQSIDALSILGIDVSKEKFDVALLVGEKYRHKRFSNNPEGFKKLGQWLAEYKVERLHACMESTNT